MSKHKKVNCDSLHVHFSKLECPFEIITSVACIKYAFSYTTYGAVNWLTAEVKAPKSVFYHK